MEILLIGVIVIFVLQKNKIINGSKFIQDNQKYFKASRRR